MKGTAKLIRSERGGAYKVFVKNFFWQRWKPLLGNDGRQIEFKNFKEFGDITHIEAFGEICLKYGKYQWNATLISEIWKKK